MLKIKPIVFLLLFLLIVPLHAFAENGFEVSAGVAVLMEASTGQVLYAKNAEQPLPPASITKLMTLLLAFEALENGQVSWEETVIVSEKAWRMGGSEMFLELGQEVTFSDLITGISVVSANDGCIAVAEHLLGSEEAFVQRMNQRATELGMTRTTFKNSNGIPAPEHQMSARDIAVLSQHLIKNHPRILELETQREFTFNNIRQFNRNPLLGTFPGADGLKTGWTDEAGFCLVGTAEQDGIRMISVVLNTVSDEERLTASQELLSHGFRDYQLTTALKPGDVPGEVQVKDGKKTSVNLTVQESVTVVVPTGREGDLELVVLSPVALEAPVAAGTPAATLDVRLDGETLTSSELVTTDEVKRANIFVRFFRAIGRLLRGLFSR
jgi:D-alanyl-D-alanine carboxypeptidase (penicillin-binding protein 5/6)